MSPVTRSSVEDVLTSWAEQVPRWMDPVDIPAPQDPLVATERLARAGLSDQLVVYERNGTWHLGAGTAAALTLGTELLRLSTGARTWAVEVSTSPLDDVAAATAALSLPQWRGFGWVSFELAHLLHGRPEAAGTSPLLHMVLPELDIELTPGRARIRAARPEQVPHVQNTLAAPASIVSTTAIPLTDPDPRAYHRAVSATVADILAGRLEKAVLSRSVPLPGAPALDLVATYLEGRRANTPARSFLLDLAGWRAVGFSPETVLEVDSKGMVQTQPLAGTRSLGPDDAENRRLRQELLRDPKEVHEHATSVRLAVDEVAQVCRPGSVAVTEFMRVRDRGSVQHLASKVTGQLDDHQSAWSALASLFPAITATGAPKAAALEAISRWEQGPRGLYGGAVLLAEHDGSLDAALVLRTVFEHEGRRWLRAGAGVMGQSTPEREWEETCEKLASIGPFLQGR